MKASRIPWEIIETFPTTTADLLSEWEAAVTNAADSAAEARALIGHAIASYWASQEVVVSEPWADVAARRSAALDRALSLARDGDDTNLIAEALLGVLYDNWGPEHHLDRDPLVAELIDLRPSISDEALLLRSIEWEVLQQLDRGDLDTARHTVEAFTDASAQTELVVFKRREVLWRGCLAMLEGRVDESLQINQDAISSTANVAGSPFSFQNVAITLAIERYLRRGLGDVVDAVRSIRASAVRVAANWDTGLAFALSEMGGDAEMAEAATLFESLAANRFERVPRDLNWLVTMQLLGLIALTIDADEAGHELIVLLRPFAHLDGTHGSGYASYGPVGRVVGSLMARWGDPDESEAVFADVLATRSDGPWTALTLFDRATARRERDPIAALADARSATVELQRWGLDEWAELATGFGDDLEASGHGGPVATHADGRWSLQHPRGAATIADSVGIHHLAWLLARPGEVVDVADLDPLVNGSVHESAGAESSLDPTAQAAYRSRLDAIDALDRPSEQDRVEADFLRRELAGGAHIVSNSAELERLRVRVTKAIRRAIDSIADESPGLGAHLRDTIETGRSCIYQPVDGRPWAVTRR